MPLDAEPGGDGGQRRRDLPRGAGTLQVREVEQVEHDREGEQRDPQPGQVSTQTPAARTRRTNGVRETPEQNPRERCGDRGVGGGVRLDDMIFSVATSFTLTYEHSSHGDLRSET